MSTHIDIRPGMFNHWTDGPKWIIDTMGFGYEPSVHGAANCLHADIDHAIELLNGDGISRVSTLYVYASPFDVTRLKTVHPLRKVVELSFPD